MKYINRWQYADKTTMDTNKCDDTQLTWLCASEWPEILWLLLSSSQRWLSTGQLG